MSSRAHPRRLAAGLLVPALLSFILAPAARAIVGGQVAPPGGWPWLGAIVDTEAPNDFLGQFCGGTVIAPRRVLTAAHCVYDASPDQLAFLLGRTRLTAGGGRRLAVTGIHLYPGWVSGRTPGLDAAVLTLHRDAGVPPVALAAPGEDAAWAAGTTAWTAGWGALQGRSSPGHEIYYADRLRQLSLPIVGDDGCENAYGGGNGDLVYRPAWTVCAGTAAGGTGSCWGDSGGPLVVGGDGAWLQVGILQGGDSCATRGYYDLYARVDALRAFALGPLSHAARVPRRPSVPSVARRKAAGRPPHDRALFAAPH